MNKILKNIFFSIGFIGVLWVNGLAWLILLLGGYRKLAFFVPTVIVIGYLIMWRYYRYGIKHKGVYLPLIMMAVVAFGVWGRLEYDESIRRIPTVSDEFNEYNYRPFGQNVATLDSPSTLRFSENDIKNLPRLDGSTALYPLYSAFFSATYPKVLADKYSETEKLIKLSKTGQAYERLLDGDADIIFVPAPSKSHQNKADEMGVTFELTPIGKEAFVFFVNSKNPVNTLTTDEIKGIYSGKITNWQGVGGHNDKIRPFQRPENSGSQTALQKIMGDTPLIEAPREDVVQGMGGIINQVADYRNFDNAIGFSFLFYSTELVRENQIKHLAINGIAPNHDNIRNETYPFAQTFYAVTLSSPTQASRDLINWIVSPQGQELVAKTGYVPIDNVAIDVASHANKKAQ